MRKPTITTRRVLGAVLATALTVAGGVALANTSQAVATPSVSLTPNTAGAAGGTVIVMKGKGFQDSSGTTVALGVTFNATACPTTIAGTAAASFNVVSATKLVATTPALTAGSWYACVYDAASGSATVLGQGTLTTAAAPTASTLTPATSTVATASVLGGTTVALAGTGFTKATKTSVDGVAAKTTYVSATKLTVVLPAHAAGTGFKVRATSEYGSVLSSDTVSFVPVISVSPTVGGTASGQVVTLTGVGLDGYDFAAATTGKQVVVFIPGGVTPTTSTTIASLNPCTSVNVESSTSLSCQAPALSGAYSVAIVTRHTTAANWGSAVTTLSRGATYTALAL